MSMAACEVFWNEKVGQAEKAVAERYLLLRRASCTPTQWAEDHAVELLATWRAGLRTVDELWSVGEFCDLFKRAVLTVMRTWLEICKRFHAELAQQEAA